MPMEQINNNGYQMFLDTDSVFAPQERAQERQAKQNALAAARQQEMQANMLRNVVSQNIDPRTGRTNWQGAMTSAPQRLLPQLQGMMSESEKAAAELAAKQATTRKTEMEGDANYWQNQRNLAALPHTQESWSAWRETLPEWSRQYVPEKFTPAAQQQVMRDSAAAIAEFNRQNLTAEQQSMATDRAVGRTETERHNRATEGIQSQQEARQGTPDPIKLRREATTLRKEFDALPEVKDFKAALPVLMSARNAPDTAAGDIDLAYAVGKIYDPKSVVRESEQKLVYTTGSVLQKLIGGANVALTGDSRLRKEVRQKLLNALNNRVLQFRQAYDQTRGTYEGYANQSGFDPVNVIGEHPASAFKPSAPPKDGGNWKDVP